MRTVVMTGLATLLVAPMHATYAVDLNQRAKFTEPVLSSADEFGSAVALDGAEALVAARADGSGASEPGWVRTWLDNGPSWSIFTRFEASDGAVTQRFGEALSVSGGYAIAGASRDDDNGTYSGSAYIFERNAAGWTQQAKLHATSPAAYDEYGAAVVINGDYAIVGSRSDDDGGSQSGSAFVYKRSGSSWPQQQKLIALDDATKDLFGSAVALDGAYALIGAPGDDTNTGSAYVFLRSGTTWTQQAKLIAGDRAGGDVFGTSVAIAGDYAAIGAPGDDSGKGSVYIFKRSGTSWAQVAKLTLSSPVAGDAFGSAVAMTAQQFAAGAPGRNGSRGSVYLYERSGSAWIQLARYIASDAAATHRLGASVALDTEHVLAGAPGFTSGAGAAYLFAAIQLDCNGNGIPDVCDTSCLPVNPLTGVTCQTVTGCGTLPDCNFNSIPDGCEPDCDTNGTPDECDIAYGAEDCDTNGVPDSCEPDCNHNGTADACDIAAGVSVDCDLDGVPDECDLLNDAPLLTATFDAGLPANWSATGLWHVTSTCVSGVQCDPPPWAYFGIDGACNFETGSAVSGVLTAPALTLPNSVTTARLRYCSNYDGDRGSAPNGFDAAWVSVNGFIVDDVGASVTQSFWETRTIDISEFAGQTVTIAWHFASNDATLNNRLGWQIDDVELIADSDCDNSGVMDACDVASGAVADCNSNNLPDSCDLASGASEDCNSNGEPDECEGGSDCNLNGVLDFCETVVMHVNANATGANDGTSWANAYSDLQTAIAAAASECVPVEIWVAAGVYRPAAAGGSRSATFVLSDNLAIYGGFTGAETSRAQRNANPLTNNTILSGDLDGGGPANNSYHVVTALSTDDSAILDGFSVRDGVADGTNPNDRGAGLRMSAADATIVNCAFTGHSAGAGAISVAGGAPTFTDCLVMGNTAQYGGGFQIYSAAKPTLSACRVLGNASVSGGSGGGVYIASTSNATLVNCAVAANTTVGNGAGLFVQSTSVATLINCTVNRNIASLSGGGAFVTINSRVSVRNSILWQNQDAGGVDESAQLDRSNSTLQVRYSCVQGWTGALSGAGNTGSDPFFADANGPDGLYGTIDDDVQLAPGSPCIDAGSNGPANTGSDLRGLPRRINDVNTVDSGVGTPPIVDMGAYEFQSDCNGNGQADSTDVYTGASRDCNLNLTPDECEIAAAGGAPGGPYFCTEDCAADCNHNGVPDECDISGGTSSDCAGEGVPDECEGDCNTNGIADSCDIAAGAVDCDSNGVPDVCELADGDCDGSGVLDACEIASAYITIEPGQLEPLRWPITLSFVIPNAKPSVSSVSFYFFAIGDLGGPEEYVNVRLNGTPIGEVYDTSLDDCTVFPLRDEIVLTAAAYNALLTGGDALVEIVPSSAVDIVPCAAYIRPSVQYQLFRDCDANGIPDDCEPDCNANGVADACDLASGSSADCNANGVPDECDIAGGTSTDGDANTIPDDCEQDCDNNGVPDECDVSCANAVMASGAACQTAFALVCGQATDCNSNGVPDDCDLDCDQDGLVDSCAIAAGSAPDCDGNSVPDVCDVAGGSADCDANGTPDACQPDTDGDHIIDACDGCPADGTKTAPGACGCGVPDTDTDADGVPNCLDACPGTAPGEEVDNVGCPLVGACCVDLTQCLEPMDRDLCELLPPLGVGGTYQGNGSTCSTDGDNDGVANCDDACPDDPTKIDPEQCGCHIAETDTDNDGVPDCLDLCPATAAGVAVDSNGCHTYGACCSPSGGCIMNTFVNKAFCDSLQWNYGGNGSTCALQCQARGLGDYDADGDVDRADFSHFAGCQGLPLQADGYLMPSALCRTVFDFDADGDVDLRDFGAFGQEMAQ